MVDGAARGAKDRVDTHALLLAHGAGAGASSPWMRQWARKLRALGPVCTFDYPYAAAGRRRPDRHAVLLDAHRRALTRFRSRVQHPVVLAGKSMGSRIGCHLSLEERVRAVVCFGYPLVSVSGAVRDEVLLALDTPVLFVSGSRDPLCPLAHLDRVRARMSAPSALHVVQGGDHSLLVRKRELSARGATQLSVDDAVLEAVRAFLE